MKVCLLMFLLGVLSAPAASPPVELGSVRWLRDLDHGFARARTSDRPLLILFQEVPGCSTCQSYGANVLAHPLIEEAIEDLFVPVAIFNNREGRDRMALDRFSEPSWSNPAVRIVDRNGRALAERVSGNYSRGGLVDAMINALREMGHDIPDYLRLFQAECRSNARTTDRAVFAMACFWSGESRLGAIEGVVETRPGFLHGEEIVEVRYDPRVVAYPDLVKTAKTLHCTRKVYTRNPGQQRIAEQWVGRDARFTETPVRPDTQPKYFLAATSFRYVPMTPMQAARVNGAIGNRTDPEAFLSPRQRRILQWVERHPQRVWHPLVGATDLHAAWQQVQEAMARNAVPRAPVNGR